MARSAPIGFLRIIEMAEALGKILVADDDPVNRRILKTILEAQGHEVKLAVNGREALDFLRAAPCDVVLLDLLMPELDGYQVLKQMKADDALQPIPVIVITALDETDSVIRCIEMGATDYLTKPVDAVLLRARLNASLAGKRLHDERQRYLGEIEELARQLKVRNRFIRETLDRYLSDEVVCTLLETPGGLELGGEKRKVTMLMSDIRGFSAIAEKLPPEQVVRLINNYLGTMADVIIEYGGTIDEFIGDSILALFGAPLSREDDARRAVACAIAMQKKMSEVNRVNREQGLPEVMVGIAVNTGEVVVGNIGSAKRAKYGAVGSQVNLTARIESNTVGGQVMISDATRREIEADAVFCATHSIIAKGFPDPITIHDLLGIGGEYSLFLDRVESPLHPLDPPVRVVYSLMEGKRCGDAEHCGELIGLSEQCVDLRTPAPVEPLRDLKMRWFDRDNREICREIYGKILPRAAGREQALRVHFTSLPIEAAAFRDKLLAGKK